MSHSDCMNDLPIIVTFKLQCTWDMLLFRNLNAMSEGIYRVGWCHLLIVFIKKTYIHKTRRVFGGMLCLMVCRRPHRQGGSFCGTKSTSRALKLAAPDLYLWDLQLRASRSTVQGPVPRSTDPPQTPDRSLSVHWRVAPAGEGSWTGDNRRSGGGGGDLARPWPI